jgi:hypothetical protein
VEFLHNFRTAVLAGNVLTGALTVTVTDSSTLPAETSYRALLGNEVIKITAIAGNVLTIERGLEGTSDGPHNTGDTIYVVATAGGITELRKQAIDHLNAVLFREVGVDLHTLRFALDAYTADRIITLPNKSGTLAMLDDVNAGIAPATVSTLGGVIVGDGLSVDGDGVISVDALTAADVGAVPLASKDASGGVPGLTTQAGGTAAQIFAGSRVNQHRVPLGIVRAYGVWNVVGNTAGTYVDPAAATWTLALAANGQITATNGASFTFTADGYLYYVNGNAAFSLDGYTDFKTGDMLISLNGKWRKVFDADVAAQIAAAMLQANTATTNASDANTAASAAFLAATSPPVVELDETDGATWVLEATARSGVIYCDRDTTALDIEVPLNATVPIPSGYNVRVVQLDAEAVTLVPESGGVTLLGKTVTTGVNDVINLHKRSADVWFGY